MLVFDFTDDSFAQHLTIIEKNAKNTENILQKSINVFTIIKNYAFVKPLFTILLYWVIYLTYWEFKQVYKFTKNAK